MERKLPRELRKGDWVRVPHVNCIKLVERAQDVALVLVARLLPGNPGADLVLLRTSGGACWLLDPSVELEVYTIEEARQRVLLERELRAGAEDFGRTLGVPPGDNLPPSGT